MENWLFTEFARAADYGGPYELRTADCELRLFYKR